MLFLCLFALLCYHSFWLYRVFFLSLLNKKCSISCHSFTEHKCGAVNTPLKSDRLCLVLHFLSLFDTFSAFNKALIQTITVFLLSYLY